MSIQKPSGFRTLAERDYRPYCFGRAESRIGSRVQQVVMGLD